MIRFECDYSEGAHPKIIRILSETNFEQTSGYGTDEYCEKARRLIKEICGAPGAHVHFLVGGTQANRTVISSILRPHQGVLSACTGHINIHETGAIEAAGHKVLPLPSPDGKITAEQIENAYQEHWSDETHEHMVQPGMVYISNPTENGTIYTKSELSSLSEVCKKYELPLYMDGARLGYGLVADNNDLTLEDIARLCDVFYIGGTKVGALFGEAVVIVNPALQKDFRYFIKQNGGMLAKGRILGLQFLALMEDNLYLDISRHAVRLAMKLKAALSDKGYGFLYESCTNQQFPIMPDAHLDALSGKYAYSIWEKTDDLHTAVRFCTSWATREEAVVKLISDIKGL
ncbi:MAG: low specificity L-threonine aldolase [Clostridiales bacterium]|jgi:threonine aldolase|nr:low specificity L-threonine aldolase [Clostridiales bacterium]